MAQITSNLAEQLLEQLYIFRTKNTINTSPESKPKRAPELLLLRTTPVKPQVRSK